MMRPPPRHYQYHAERIFADIYEPRQRSSYNNSSDQAAEEFKKILILAGVFFFILIICIMSKLQVDTEDVLRWSPIVWLVGVCIAGGLMNLLFYCQKKISERKRQRRRVERDLLYSLPLPHSYPCLAPSPHIGCCRTSNLVNSSNMSLPTYEDVLQKKDDCPPAYSDAVAMLSPSSSSNSPSPV